MRRRFGGSQSDWAFNFSSLIVQKSSGVTITFWTQLTGGTHITDLQDTLGNPITSITTDAYGEFPEFYGPDGTFKLAADAGSGTRRWIFPNDRSSPVALPAPSGDSTGVTDRTAVTAAITSDGFYKASEGNYVFDQPVVLKGLSFVDIDGEYAGGTSSHSISTDNGTVWSVASGGFTNPTYAPYATGLLLMTDSDPGHGDANDSAQLRVSNIKFDLTNAPRSLATPTGLAVVATGATGSTPYAYRVTAQNVFGETYACQEVAISNGNAALSGSNYNALSWIGVIGATSYSVYGRTSSGETVMKRGLTTTSYHDTGADTPDGATIPPLANTTGVDGIATYGAVQGLKFRDLVIYKASGQGIAQYADSAASPKTPDHLTLDGVMVEKSDGHGYFGYFIDGVGMDAHFQDNGGWGFYDLGSNGHLGTGCRFDVNGLGGFAGDVAVNTGYGATGTVLSGVSFQRNLGPDVAALNSSLTGTDVREPVFVCGAHAAAGGADGVSASLRSSGKSFLHVTGYIQSTGTIDVPGGAPKYAIETFAAGSSGGVPLPPVIEGGTLRGITAVVNPASVVTPIISPRTVILTGATSSTPQAGLGLVNAPSYVISGAGGNFGSLLEVINSAAAPASAPVGFVTPATTDKVLGIRLPTDTTSRLGIKGDGTHSWSDGTTTKTTLSPVSTGGLSLDTPMAAQHFVASDTSAKNSQPSNPASTVSTSLVMMGYGVTYTPHGSGKVLLIASGLANTSTTAVSMTLGARYGTGTAPANGAAVTGTRFGGTSDLSIRPGVVGAGETPVTLTDVLTSLTVGTQYWFDIALATSNASDAASVANFSFSIVEVP